MKRFLSVILVLSICLSLIGTVNLASAAESTAKGFLDIDGHWAKDDIEKMAEKGIINGISETEFSPESNITRAQFLALIIRVLNPNMSAYGSAYMDVTASDWYADTVQTAKYLNIIDPSMTPGNEFKPNQPITREEMTSLIVRAYEYKAKEASPKADINVFTDKDDISQWATSYVAGAYGLKIINGITATTFVPQGNATRAQAATMIRRFLANNKIGKTLSVLTIGNSWSVDGMQYLYGIANSLGYDNIILGIAYKGGLYLKGHYENIMSDEAAYTYKKNTDGKWVDSPSKTIADCLKNEDWQYIVIQQGSGDASNQFFDQHLDTLITHIKENTTNTKVKIGWHMGWAHHSESKHYTFSGIYNSDQMTMYNTLISYTQNKVAKKKDISFIIPSGTAIQNARTSFINEDLMRDDLHLDEYVGRYMAALSWFCTITGTPAEDITHNPNPTMITPEKFDVAIESVANALEKPYAITQSQYK